METGGRKNENTLSGLTINTYLLALASFFADVSTEMLYPVLPLFLAQMVQNPGGVVGIIEGISTGFAYIIQGFSGWFSDFIGRKKPIALFGYALSALAKPFIGMANSWTQVLTGRFSERLGAGIRSAPRDGLITQSADEKNRGKAFGLEGIGDNLGAVAGPLLAAYLIYAFRIDLRLIFFLAFIPAVLAFLTTLLVSEKTQSNQSFARRGLANFPIPNNSSLQKVSDRTLFVKGRVIPEFPRTYWKYLLVTAAFGVGNSSNAFLILQAKNLGATIIGAILIYAAFNLVSAAVSLPAGTLSDRIGRKKVLLFSFAISALTYTGFALSHNLLSIILLFILYGAYAGIFRAVGKSLAADFVPAERRASALGFYSATIGLTGIIASLAAGSLWETLGPSAAFILGLGSSTTGIIALILLI